MLALLSGAAFADVTPKVSSARVGAHSDFTRLVLETDMPVTASVFALTEPPRLVLDFPELQFALNENDLVPPPNGAVKAVRHGRFKPGTSRVVLDLATPANVRRAFALAPMDGHSHRLVIDIAATSATAFAESTGSAHLKRIPVSPARNARPIPMVVETIWPAPKVTVATPRTEDESRLIADDYPAHDRPTAPIDVYASNETSVADASTEETADAPLIDWPWADPVVEEVTGSVIVEGRFFANPARFDGQRRHSASIAFEPEYYVEWDDYTSFMLQPFLRVDSADSNRTHADLREAFVRTVGDDWELGFGFGKVFWGVTESVHLVDIVNQTDAIENIDLEDKLGQPMVNLTLIRDWGFLDFFYLPYFRERTFQSRAGRLRNGLVVDEQQTTYEAGAGRWNPDVAIRYANTFDDWDVGIYHFYGNSREPTLNVGFASSGELVLVPRYELINQTGTDIQYTTGPWLWKLEALYRQGQSNRLGTRQNYYALVGGYEYTLFGILDSNADLGLITEYIRDSRLNKAPTGFQNDVFLGARLALNDSQDTDVLFGIIQDLTYGTRLLSVEANRRIGDSFKLTLETRLFANVDRRDVLDGVRDDDLVQFELGYYF